jgi:hypothetical protein
VNVDSILPPPQNEGEIEAVKSVDSVSVSEGASEGASVSAENEGVEATLNPFSGDQFDTSPIALRRSSRERRPARRLIAEPLFGCKATCTNPHQRFNLRTKALRLLSFTALKMKYEESLQKLEDGTINHSHSYAFPATLADNDTYFYSQAMQQSDCQEFIKAMVKEVDDLFNSGVWQLCKRSEIGKYKPIKAIWSFK